MHNIVNRTSRRRYAILALLIVGCSSQNADSVTPGSGGKSGTGGSSSAGSGGSGSGGSGAGGGGGGTSSGSGGAAPSDSGGSGGTPAGTGGSASDASAPDTGSPAPDGGTNPSAMCGTTPAAFNLDAFTKTEGLVVAPDGTVYFSDFGPHVMRLAPPYTTPEKTWATVPGATLLGIMYDPKKKVIYAGSRGGDLMLYKIDATDPTKVEPIVATEKGFNGMTLAEDGSLFYTDQTGGTVYRVTPDDKQKTMVAKVADANGIAFGPPPDRFLYVLSYGAGTVTKLKVENNVGTAPEMFVKFAKGNADGIAFDKTGNMYVTSGALWKVAPDKTITMVNAAGGANVEFGVGALSCKELIWASGPPHHQAIDVEGMDVPWHRP